MQFIQWLKENLEFNEFYHGSNNKFNNFITPNKSNIIRQGEENREDFRDVIFLTKDIKTAKTYGKYIYKIKANSWMNYKDEYIRRVESGEIKTKKKKANLIKKLKTLPDNIFIAYPEELKIIDII